MDVLIANDYKEQLKNIDNKWKNFKYDSKKVFTKNICDILEDFENAGVEIYPSTCIPSLSYDKGTIC